MAMLDEITSSIVYNKIIKNIKNFAILYFNCLFTKNDANEKTIKRKLNI